MPQGTVHVIAIFVAAAGKEEELESVLRKLPPPTRQEAGCIRYDLARSLKGDQTEFVFIEEWESEETLDAHGQMPYIVGLRERLPGLVASPPRVVRYRQIA